VVSNPQKERKVPNKPFPQQIFMMSQSTKMKMLAFHEALDVDHKVSVLTKIRKLPKCCTLCRICIGIQNAQDGITTFTTSIETLDKFKKIHKRQGRQWELKQFLGKEKGNWQQKQCEDD
jgi:hypothetical protein